LRVRTFSPSHPNRWSEACFRSARLSSQLGENKMRQAIIISTTALFSALVALWVPTVIANPQKPNVASAAGLVGVMQMMKDARDLPDQRYDAFWNQRKRLSADQLVNWGFRLADYADGKEPMPWRLFPAERPRSRRGIIGRHLKEGGSHDQLDQASPDSSLRPSVECLSVHGMGPRLDGPDFDVGWNVGSWDRQHTTASHRRSNRILPGSGSPLEWLRRSVRGD
jgi:hypothetical protein